jgi:hypothetical protein
MNTVNKTTVNVITPDGMIRPFTSFNNDKDEKHNLVTLRMLVDKNLDVTNELKRQKYENLIEENKYSFSFNFLETVFITLRRKYKPIKK